MSCGCLRWAFRIAQWQPTSEEWLKILESIEIDEVSRIGKFHFREDAQAAAVGRLMLRKAAADRLGIRWNDVELGRSPKGKPFLKNETGRRFSFNVSHQGDYVVLAASDDAYCGVDVMKIEYPRATKSVDDYLTLMKRQFSVEEFASFSKTNDDWKKLTLFYRYWCLKESYIKALGVGIHNNLAGLDFRLKNFVLNLTSVTTDTKLIAETNLQWKFEESLIDENHIVAVCREISQPPCCPVHDQNGLLFTSISPNQLLSTARPLHVVSPQKFDAYTRKAAKNKV